MKHLTLINKINVQTKFELYEGFNNKNYNPNQIYTYKNCFTGFIKPQKTQIGTALKEEFIMNGVLHNIPELIKLGILSRNFNTPNELEKLNLKNNEIPIQYGAWRAIRIATIEEIETYNYYTNIKKYNL